ncbi:uncharacterized protein LOC144452014 isoform X2 [Glandiceps talaboti]
MASSEPEDAVRGSDGGGGEKPPPTIGQYRTKLLGAITQGNSERIRELLETIPPGDLTQLRSDTKGRLSVLHTAVEAGNVELVQLFLDKGFVASAVNQKGQKPIDIAQAAKNEDMVRVLSSSCEVADTESTKESNVIESSTRDAVFNFLKRRLSNNKWKEFFKVLGFSHKDVMELKFHYINISLEECIAQGLASWYKKDGDIGRMFGALCHEKVNQRILVDEIKRRFTKLRSVAIKPILSEGGITEGTNDVAAESNGMNNGRIERSNSGHEHTPSQTRKKLGLFDKISSSVRKFSTTTSSDDSVLTEPKKVRKGRRFSVDESRKSHHRVADAFGHRRGSYDDDKIGKTRGNEPFEKLEFLKEDSEDPVSTEGKSPQSPILQVVEADIHTESTTTDESGRQSLASTPRTRRSVDDTSLFIHESGSDGSITPRSSSPRSSKKKNRDSDGSFKFRNINLPSPSIFRKKYRTPPASPSTKPNSPKKTQKNFSRRRKNGHVPPTSNSVENHEINDSDNTAGFFLLPSVERYSNDPVTSSETTSDEASDRQSSRKDSSETQTSVHTEMSSEYNRDGVDDDDGTVDEATQHLLDAGKSIEILLTSLINEDRNDEYKTTTVDKSSQSVVVELVDKSSNHVINPHRPLGRQRSYSDSDVKVQRIITKTKSGTFRMDFYFRQRANSSRSLNFDMPINIRQTPLRRHSEQTYPTTEGFSDPVWQLRPTHRRRKVTLEGVEPNQGDYYQHRRDLSTTM